MEADGTDRVTVKFNEYKWIVNESTCQLVDAVQLAHIDVSTDSDSDQSSRMSQHCTLSLYVCLSYCDIAPGTASDQQYTLYSGVLV